MFDHKTAAIISQETEKELQLLEFMFMKVTSTEQNYTITKKNASNNLDSQGV